jgi:cysteine desulfurase
MWANNETGVIWPIQEIAVICNQKGVLLHTDAVQAASKISVDFAICGASFLSLSGHKFGAPKGIGAILIAEPESFNPMIHGGKQENGLRGGTESVPLIVALGAAAESVKKRDVDCWNPIKKLRDEFESLMKQRIPNSVINGGSSKRIPNTSNVYLSGLDGDALVTFLDQKGIYVSSGSACLESAITPSHVILAMSNSHERASESIRISIGLNTNAEELLRLTEAIANFSAVNP